MSETRTANYDWFINTNLQEYAGEWVAILNKKVVAHEQDLKLLLERVKKTYPGKKPSLVKISDKLAIL